MPGDTANRYGCQCLTSFRRAGRRAVVFWSRKKATREGDLVLPVKLAIPGRLPSVWPYWMALRESPQSSHQTDFESAPDMERCLFVQRQRCRSRAEASRQPMPWLWFRSYVCSSCHRHPSMKNGSPAGCQIVDNLSLYYVVSRTPSRIRILKEKTCKLLIFIVIKFQSSSGQQLVPSSGVAFLAEERTKPLFRETSLRSYCPFRGSGPSRFLHESTRFQSLWESAWSRATSYLLSL